MTRTRMFRVILPVANLDRAVSFWRRVLVADGRGLTEIASMPWGERLFCARDPLGSQFCFVDAATVFTGAG